MKVDGRYYVYNADDEEPICGRCDNYNEDDAYFCIRYCGSEHAWNGYERAEIADI